MESKQMEGQTELQQCSKAILHVLEQIRTNKNAADVFGLGSQSFALLTEAYATLRKEPLAKVRELYA